MAVCQPPDRFRPLPGHLSMRFVVYFGRMSVLEQYVKAFRSLKRGNTPGTTERAPHKPVLLLAVLDEIAAGQIPTNQIVISPELVARFRDEWSRRVRSPFFKPDFTKPFYHLKGEGFWHPVPRPGREFLLTTSHSPRSFSSLQDTVRYVQLDEPLFRLLRDPSSRAVLRQVLLSTYFGDAPAAGPGYIDTVAQQMLEEAPGTYRRLAQGFDEEELVARSAVFKRVIPRIYNYTCCISGMQVLAGPSVQMVDACHILPFAESRDDTITNGLSLCPNLHRAFDRGLIRIDDRYRVSVSPSVQEPTGAAYGIRAFEGQPLRLPQDRAHWHGLDNLEAHWKRWQGNY